MKISIHVLAALALLSVGCASVPRASADRDAVVKRFEVAPGKANLYVFRDETYGGSWAASVLVDGRLVGDTVHHTFVFAQIEPGPHKIMSKAENDSDLAFTAEAGRNHFVFQEMKMGVWRARATLHLVDEQRGRSGVNACELIQSP